MRDRNLTEGFTTDEQNGLGDLSLVQKSLDGYEVALARPEDTAALLARLRPLVAARALKPQPEVLPDLPPPDRSIRYWVNLAWGQTTIMESPFWWASGILFVLGFIVEMLDPAGALAITFVLASPVIAAASVAYVFRPETRTVWELEKASPVQPLELLYARLGLVLSFNLLFTLTLLGLLWINEPRAVLWRLVIAWLGPMLGLAGSALYASVRWGAIAGVAVPMGAWAAMMLTGWQYLTREAGIERLSSVQIVPLISQSNGLVVGALAAMLAGLVLMRQGGRLALGESDSWS